MSRPRIDVAVPALALRRAEAAASLGVSPETFDAHVRPYVPSVNCGTVVVYPVTGLQRFLADHHSYDGINGNGGAAVIATPGAVAQGGGLHEQL